MSERRPRRVVLRDPDPDERERADCAPADAIEAHPIVQQIEFVADLILAMTEKKPAEIRAILRAPLARSLPAEIIAEAMRFAKLPADNHLAPIRTLRYAHRLEQLYVQDFTEPEPSPQLELGFLNNDEEDSRPW